MKAQVTFLLRLVAAVALSSSTLSAGRSQTLGQLQRDVRTAISDGRYSTAEDLAREFFTSLGGLTAADRLDAMDAGDLLLRTLVENGRGSDQDTQNLALEMVRSHGPVGLRPVPGRRLSPRD